MTLCRIVNVRVDSSLKNIFEILWLSVSTFGQTGEMNVKEGGAIYDISPPFGHFI